MKVKNVGTGLEHTTQTSAEGNHAISEFPIGTYAVTATGDVGISNPFLGERGSRGIQCAAKVTF